MTTRPNIRPFPLAVSDSVVATPAEVADSARASVLSLGLKLAAFSREEGYLETRWYDVATHRSHRYNTNPERFVRLRVWTDLVTPQETQIVVETVRRATIDPSLPDREAERVAEPETPGDSLTSSVIGAVRRGFGKIRPDSTGKPSP